MHIMGDTSCPIEVEPPHRDIVFMAECFTHESPPGLQEPSKLLYWLHSHDQRWSCKSHVGEHCKNCKGWGGSKGDC